MKKFMKSFALLAVAALGLSACNDDKLVPDNGNADGKFVTVHFGAEAAIEGATKATLTPDEGETAFNAMWEKGDKIAIEYTYVDAGKTETVPGTWDASALKFSAELTDLTTGDEVRKMKYQASYPYSKDGVVDFGSARTQTGNAYNSVYDLMVAEHVTVTAKPGLDESGNAIVFPMQRQTAIAYFHFTSDNTEAITKATLKVEGEDAAIAAETVLLDPTGMDYETGLSEIVLTTTGQTADDFTLWFNVLPTTYTKMTLIVETATKTFTISNTKGGSYTAGKLYKVKKVVSWTDKGGSVTPSEKVSVINVENVNAVKAMGNGSYGDYKDAVQTITVDGLEYSMTNICANSKNGNSGYMMEAKQFIQMKTSTSYIQNTKAGVTSIKAWVLPKTTDAISVYQGTAADKITNLLDKPNKSTETVTLVSNTGSGVDTQLDIYEYTITGGFFKLAPSAALWLYKLEVTYSDGSSSEPTPATYSISCAEVTGGTLSASPAKAEAGAEVTLTATPDSGYAFNNDWSVKGADETVIEVVDGKFTMPAQNVTVSGTFSKVAYTITKAAAENGSFTVKNGTEEVTTAFKGDKLTLEAIPVEGFTFGKWTVTYMDGETEKSFNPSANTFNMPAANVTVSATFVEAAAVPVYASVAELIAAGDPTETATKVTVTLKDEEITKFYKSGTYTNGVYFMVGTQEVQIYCRNTPSEWKVGGTISGTLKNCDWKLYKSTWELCPADYSELTYKAPLPTCATPVITIAEGGVVSITCDTAGATIHYTVGDAPDDPTEADAVFSAVTLTDGQTIKAIAVAKDHKPSAVALKKYVVGGSALDDKTATITFGTNDVKINKASVTANDDQKNSWTITTVGTTSFTPNAGYYQVGKKDAPATSITFTTTLPEDAEVTSISAKFGGFSGTAGTVTLKVGETSVGTGKLNAGTDVTVTSTSTAVGNKVTITVTNIAKGVKCYNIQVKYKTAN